MPRNIPRGVIHINILLTFIIGINTIEKVATVININDVEK